MPLNISSADIAEKNKLSRSSAYIILAEITIPGTATPVRVARNTEDVTWNGHTWQWFPFEVDEISESSKNESPRVTLQIGNVNRTIETYLEEYDAYCKANGPERITVTIYVVNSNNLASGVPIAQYTFNLKQPKVNARWATFLLGAINTMMRRVPQERTLRDACQFKFKGTRCGYAGAETACDKTLTRCRVLANSNRYGGFPGAGYGGISLA